MKTYTSFAGPLWDLYEPYLKDIGLTHLTREKFKTFYDLYDTPAEIIDKISKRLDAELLLYKLGE